MHDFVCRGKKGFEKHCPKERTEIGDGLKQCVDENVLTYD